MTDKKSFIVYETWGEVAKRLPAEDAGILFQAMCKYQSGEAVEIDNPYIKAIFEGQIKPKMDEDAAKYEETCKRNGGNGAKGGRPKKPKETQNNPLGFSETHSNPKKADTDTDTDTDTGTVSPKGDNTPPISPSEEETELQGYFNDPDLNKAFNDYVAYRMKLNKPVDFTRTQRQLYDLANGDIKTMIAIIDQSLANGWTGLFALKDKDTKGKAPPSTYYSDRLAKKMAEQDDTLIEDERFK